MVASTSTTPDWGTTRETVTKWCAREATPALIRGEPDAILTAAYGADQDDWPENLSDLAADFDRAVDRTASLAGSGRAKMTARAMDDWWELLSAFYTALREDLHQE